MWTRRGSSRHPRAPGLQSPRPQPPSPLSGPASSGFQQAHQGRGRGSVPEDDSGQIGDGDGGASPLHPVTPRPREQIGDGDAAGGRKSDLRNHQAIVQPRKSDLRNHQAIVQPRLYDCFKFKLMVTQITLNTEP
jgi:hypothetical protein